MKKLLMIAAMALAGATMAMTLQEAAAKIPEAVANPASTADIVKELSPDDQVEFLSMLNAAIAKMNGSADELSSIFLAVNEAALKAHGKGNLQAMLATTFATVPPEHLTVLNERLAKDLFNRNADPTRPISDADFAKLAKDAMQTIATRASDTDDAAVRTTFALLMFVRASEGTPADLRNTLAETISDPAARELAINEWVPAAMGENTPKTYDPMLGASDVAADVPVPTSVLTIANSQDIVPLLSDLAADHAEYEHSIGMGIGNAGLPGFAPTINSRPVTKNEYLPWSSGNKRGERRDSEEPRTYPFQSIYD